MVALNIIFYLFIFIIGITFGSFYTLAVYRIPLKQDITHTRSYCPNCNHKLSFFDMIPILSYIFLKGKCRYCGNKIRIRYLLLEVLSGIIFILFAIPLKNSILMLNFSYILYFITGILYITGIFIIAGIDKEKQEIRNEVILYIVIVETLYIIYLYILQSVNVYRYVMYLLAIILLVVVNNIYLNKNAKNSYTISTLILIMEMCIFTYELNTIMTIILTLLVIAIIKLLSNLTSKKFIKNDNKDENKKAIPMAYYLCICNLIVLIITNFISLNN